MNLGIKLPLNNINIFTPTTTTLDTVKTNLINLMLTEKGERFMKPSYGVGLRRFLFEQNIESVQDEIGYVIRTEAQKWMPSIEILEVNVEQSIDSYLIEIELKYSIKGTPLTDTVNITLQP